MAHVHHAVQAAPQIKEVLVGVTYMSAFIWSAASAVVGGIIGWLIGKIGISGIETDVANVKADIVSLKNKVNPVAVATAV